MVRNGGIVKTILVLDDEVSLRQPLCRLLQLHGYRTLEAGDAEEALQQFHDNDCQIDLLIADVSLPIGSGSPSSGGTSGKATGVGSDSGNGLPFPDVESRGIMHFWGGWDRIR